MQTDLTTNFATLRVCACVRRSFIKRYFICTFVVIYIFSVIFLQASSFFLYIYYIISYTIHSKQAHTQIELYTSFMYMHV